LSLCADHGDADGDGGTELLLIHPDNVDHDGTEVEGFAAVWMDLETGALAPTHGIAGLEAFGWRVFRGGESP